MKPLLFFMIILLASNCQERTAPKVDPPQKSDKPMVSFTFDDGITNDIVDYKFEDWNQMILNALQEAGATSMFFVTGFNKTSRKGKFLLSEWDKENHKIANHTYTHANFNDTINTLDIFTDELVRTDSIINQYRNYTKFFRFPYLKEGKTKEKIEGIRSILDREEYENGYVTIDASDWYVNARLIDKMRSGEHVDTFAFQEFYLKHILDRANYYESLSYELTGRHIKHTLLLHHNLTSALFLQPLIKKFTAEGWDIVDAIDAYQDPLYQSRPNVVPAGESLIWSLAKASEKYEGQLRYPAEDSRYEKDEMNQLGL